jgi:hypothetical protein
LGGGSPGCERNKKVLSNLIHEGLSCFAKTGGTTATATTTTALTTTTATALTTTAATTATTAATPSRNISGNSLERFFNGQAMNKI